jgi:3-oxoacyl-[acyl-carrier protein] reductase
VSGRGTARPAALITGAGRLRGIAAGIAARLADDGWDLALTTWRHDATGAQPSTPDEAGRIAARAESRGATVVMIQADLSDPAEPDRVVGEAAAGIGPLRGMVLCHAESWDSTVLDTTVDSFDRHMAVNARASWQLIAAFARQATAGGAIVALTSGATEGEVAYGASKAALDRIVVAAARELGPQGIRANLVDPGPIDTGWIDDPHRAELIRQQPKGRLGTPADIARIVSFLLSEDGSWTTGQHIHSDGGFSR